jgi:hypothetical protein
LPARPGSFPVEIAPSANDVDGADRLQAFMVGCKQPFGRDMNVVICRRERRERMPGPARTTQ